MKKINEIDLGRFEFAPARVDLVQCDTVELNATVEERLFNSIIARINFGVVDYIQNAMSNPAHFDFFLKSILVRLFVGVQSRKEKEVLTLGHAKVNQARWGRKVSVIINLIDEFASEYYSRCDAVRLLRRASI